MAVGDSGFGDFAKNCVPFASRFNRSDEDGKAVEHDAIQLRGRDGVRFVEVAARPDGTVHDPKPLARKLVVDEAHTQPAVGRIHLLQRIDERRPHDASRFVR